MTWENSAWLFGLLGVPVLALLFATMAFRHRRRLGSRFTGKLFERVLPTSVRVRRTFRDVATLGGFAALILALAEPRFGERIIQVEQKGVDLVIAVDLSTSMNARDVDPSRLERARREIFDILDGLDGDRVGLVVFAGGAYPRMPLTADVDAMKLIASELDTATFQSQGSELGLAIRAALKLLEASRDNAGQGILVLSDGEIHRPEDVLEAAVEADDAGVRIYGLVIGREATPIPLSDGTWLYDESGRTVFSKPDSGVLTEMARLTGGAVAQSIASADDVEELLATMRGELRAGERGTVQRRVAQSAFQWPLGIGLFLLLFAAWLGDGLGSWGRFSAVRGVSVGGALALAVVLPTVVQAATPTDADAMYRAGDYEAAEESLRELIVENPGDADLWGRLGAARYRLGDADGAAIAFEEQDRLSGDDADAAFNAGNSHYAAHRWEEALHQYERALELDSGHDGAAKNKSVVEQQIKAFRQRTKPPDQGDDGGQRPGASAENQGGNSGQSDEAQGKGQARGQADPRPATGDASSSDTREGRRSPGVGEEGTDGSNGQVTTQERSDGAPTGATSLGELSGPETETALQPSGSTPSTSGTMTAAQAERLLDGIEEGRPRVVIPGDASGEKPW